MSHFWRVCVLYCSEAGSRGQGSLSSADCTMKISISRVTYSLLWTGGWGGGGSESDCSVESLNGRLRLEIKKFVAWGRGSELFNDNRERSDKIHNRFVLQVESPRSGELQKKKFLFLVYVTSRMPSTCATILGNRQRKTLPTTFWSSRENHRLTWKFRRR